VFFRNKKVLVTGGLGFIGSNLAIRLAGQGARVVIVDSSEPGCGANLFNIEPIRESVEVIHASIADAEKLGDAFHGCDVIFNLAGELSHLHSMMYPERDLEINTLAQLRFLQECGRVAPGIRVVYAGTRQVYGAPRYLPVDENHPVNPVDFNGVHKYAATMYHLMLSNMGHLDAAVLRLTNVYGPRMALNVPCQGFLGTFFRKVLTGQTLDIFGDGQQLRDPLFVDDAVEAFLAAGSARTLEARSYNVGGPEALTLQSIADSASLAAEVAAPRPREFPEDRKQIDIGSYHTDSSRIREQLRWRAKVRFQEGVRATIDYYRPRLEKYMDLRDPNPECKLTGNHQMPSRKTLTVPA
jgi:UDP-glucose 4-epimerase